MEAEHSITVTGLYGYNITDNKSPYQSSHDAPVRTQVHSPLIILS